MNFKTPGGFLLPFSAFLIIMVFTVSLHAEYIFLTDGSIVEGSIITDGENSVTLKMADNKLLKISRNTIMRILYTKLKMWKVYVRKRDGKELVAFMVDENQESYTFRKELNKPEEFVLKREEVLFISEKNPAGLQVEGTIGTDRVSLSWLPPYDAVDKYIIYIKKNDNDKYLPAAESKDKSVTLKKLSSNTEYFIIVTSVDSYGSESAASNELKIKTKNVPPERPEITSSGDLTSSDRKITWNPSVDSDGKVKQYIIYGTKKGKREVIARTEKTDYLLKKSQDYTRVDISAVDEVGDESDTSKVRILIKKLTMSFQPSIIFPVGTFSEMFWPGFGAIEDVTRHNLWINNFDAGLNVGFYYLHGKDLREDLNLEFTHFFFMPFYVTIGYNLFRLNGLSMKPIVSVGIAYLNVEYVDRNKTAAEEPTQYLHIFKPTFKTGLSAEYKYTNSIFFSAGCEYGMVYQNDGSLNYMLINAGAGFFF
ncbi:MAG: fibronectin type III domain-containing protein [Spirochaetes bacterium]|nr:fibronectin type III domain-containing protein [Spirochaetota bacterium]